MELSRRCAFGLLGVMTALAGASSLRAQEPPPRSVTLLDGVPATPGPAPFLDGEDLTYEMTAPLGLTLGTGKMVVVPGATYQGMPVIHLKGSASGSAPFGIQKASGGSESWIDPVELFSLAFITDQDSSNVDDRQEWRFDYLRGIAVRDRVRTKNGVTKSSTGYERTLAKTHVQDAHSMLYFFRAFPVKVGSKLESDVYTSKKMWKLTVRVPAREVVKTPAGKFTCLKVIPEVSLDGVKRQDGQVTVWVTDDEKRIPVKIQTQTRFGKLNATLLRQN